MEFQASVSELGSIQFLCHLQLPWNLVRPSQLTKSAISMHLFPRTISLGSHWHGPKNVGKLQPAVACSSEHEHSLQHKSWPSNIILQWGCIGVITSEGAMTSKLMESHFNTESDRRHFRGLCGTLDFCLQLSWSGWAQCNDGMSGFYHHDCWNVQ